MTESTNFCPESNSLLQKHFANVSNVRRKRLAAVVEFIWMPTLQIFLFVMFFILYESAGQSVPTVLIRTWQLGLF